MAWQEWPDIDDPAIREEIRSDVSYFEGATCSYCGREFVAGEEWDHGAYTGRPFHRRCWEENTPGVAPQGKRSR